MTEEEKQREEQAAAAIRAKLDDRRWRINNLYWIQDENGRRVKFRLNWAQDLLYTALWWLNVVLKARQVGISTFALIFALDRALFTEDQTCGIVDKTDEDAKKKLNRAKYAYDNLDNPTDPAGKPSPTAKLGVLIKQAVKITAKNEHEVAFSNGSKLWAGTNLRGGTVQFLWISELGYIAYYFPEKAKEIAAGALNTVHAGNIVLIESTHEGGKYGLNYRMVKLAQEAPRRLTKLDWLFHFFPWHKHPGYRLSLIGGPLVLTREQEQYFRDLERNEGVKLADEQKHWYLKKLATLAEAMNKEFPSTAEEALNAVVTGAIYGKQISKLRRERRIIDFEADGLAPLWTFWDIGFSDFTSIWLLQIVGRDVCALSCFSWHGEPAAFYATKMAEWERQYNRLILAHYLPHDANTTEKGSGKTYVQHLAEAGLKNIKVVPRTPDEWVGINHLRALLPRFVFHKTECEREFKTPDLILPSGISALESYHTKTTPTASGNIVEAPVHDEASHAASALRTFAEAHSRGMIEGVSHVAADSRRAAVEDRRTVRVITRKDQRSGRLGLRKPIVRVS